MLRLFHCKASFAILGNTMTMVSFAIFLFLILLLQPSFSIAANITLGSSLTTDDQNTPWTSPSGNFAFGFRQLNSSKLFLLAVWFYQIPDRTIVWYANGDNPAPRGSKVELTSTNLMLTDPKGLIIWQANPVGTVSYAAMLDTGNFVLSGTDSDVWESFSNPADTILPGQILDLGSMLSSRLTETNFSKGRFELHFDNGSLEINPIAWPSKSQYNSYYSSQTYNVHPSESGYQLVFNASTNDIYIIKGNGEIVQLPRWANVSARQDQYYRATLDFNGVFTQYAHPRNSSSNQTWWALRSVPINMCLAIFYDLGSGPCGFNSYCTIKNSVPRCDCPPGYVFIDPSNQLSDCRPTFPQGCGLDDDLRNPEEVYQFRELENVDFPLSDYERLAPYNETQCEKSCLHDCSCAVAVFDGNTCWKKRLPLSNGRTWTSTFKRVLFKVRKDVPFTGYPDIRRKNDKPILLIVLLGASSSLNAVLLVATSLILYRRRGKKTVKNEQDSSHPETTLRFFAYTELEEATDCFREELGRGSFGIVYKGVLKTGSRNVIAVKKLDNLAQEREREFRTEVSAIGRTYHKNLVRLLGYCDEGSHRLLIYEFMSNGTLANFLFSLPRPEWLQRVRIVLGIARGLFYLHEECEVPIIHCDIKPQNILLDDYLTARISDFGLAKLLLSDQTRTRTMIRGSRGYVAPEWFKNVPVTSKVDVYSFGVMLLEIICCRKSVVMESEAEEKAILTDWAYDCFVEGRLDILVDNDKAAMEDKDRLQNWVTIAMWCIQEHPSNRPTMKMVMEMLEGFVEVPSLSCSSSFSSNIRHQSQW